MNSHYLQFILPVEYALRGAWGLVIYSKPFSLENWLIPGCHVGDSTERCEVFPPRG
jgi:hypothetical protein